MFKVGDIIQPKEGRNSSNGLTFYGDLKVEVLEAPCKQSSWEKASVLALITSGHMKKNYARIVVKRFKRADKAMFTFERKNYFNKHDLCIVFTDAFKVVSSTSQGKPTSVIHTEGINKDAFMCLLS
jgi:hypothetical protein